MFDEYTREVDFMSKYVENLLLLYAFGVLMFHTLIKQDNSSSAHDLQGTAHTACC